MLTRLTILKTIFLIIFVYLAIGANYSFAEKTNRSSYPNTMVPRAIVYEENLTANANTDENSPGGLDKCLIGTGKVIAWPFVTFYKACRNIFDGFPRSLFIRANDLKRKKNERMEELMLLNPEAITQAYNDILSIETMNSEAMNLLLSDLSAQERAVFVRELLSFSNKLHRTMYPGKSSTFYDYLSTNLFLSYIQNHVAFDAMGGGWESWPEMWGSDSIGTYDGMYFTFLTHAISENPVLGGNPGRGIQGDAQLALIKILTHRSPLMMTPDGLVIPPQKPYVLKFYQYDEEDAIGSLKLADLYLGVLQEVPTINGTAEKFFPLGKNLRISMTQSASRFEDYSEDTAVSQIPKNPAELRKGVYITTTPLFGENFDKASSKDLAVRKYYVAFTVASLGNTDAEVAKAYDAAQRIIKIRSDNEDTLAAEVGAVLDSMKSVWEKVAVRPSQAIMNNFKEAAITYIRGGMTGLLISSPFGIDAGTGFLYGGSTNVLRFIWNRMKDQDLSPEQAAAIFQVVDKLTIKPRDKTGMIDMGRNFSFKVKQVGTSKAIAYMHKFVQEDRHGTYVSWARCSMFEDLITEPKAYFLESDKLE